MKVICALCDIHKEIEDNSLLAKKTRNHPINLYICDDCYQRIKEKRLERTKEKENNPDSEKKEEL